MIELDQCHIHIHDQIKLKSLFSAFEVEPRLYIVSISDLIGKKKSTVCVQHVVFSICNNESLNHL